MIGEWVTKQDCGLRIGVSWFTLPKGMKVEIEQIDKEHNKVLLRIGESIDWISTSWLLNNCERMENSFQSFV